MSAVRIAQERKVPLALRRAFYTADHPRCPEELLEREIAARAVLDATGLTGEAIAADHNSAMRDARRWFRFGESVEAVFDNAGLTIERVRQIMLAVKVRYRKK